MVGEAFAGLGAIKTAFDLARGIKDISDTTARNLAVADLLDKLITARENQQTLLDRVGALEAEIAGFKDWERERQRYELNPIPGGVVAYMLKPAERGEQPPHWVCPQCFAQAKLSYFQPTGAMIHRLSVFKCGGCQTAISVPGSPNWV